MQIWYKYPELYILPFRPLGNVLCTSSTLPNLYFPSVNVFRHVTVEFSAGDRHFPSGGTSVEGCPQDGLGGPAEWCFWGAAEQTRAGRVVETRAKELLSETRPFPRSTFSFSDKTPHAFKSQCGFPFLE